MRNISIFRGASVKRYVVMPRVINFVLWLGYSFCSVPSFIVYIQGVNCQRVMRVKTLQGLAIITSNVVAMLCKSVIIVKSANYEHVTCYILVMVESWDLTSACWIRTENTKIKIKYRVRISFCFHRGHWPVMEIFLRKAQVSLILSLNFCCLR